MAVTEDSYSESNRNSDCNLSATFVKYAQSFTASANGGLSSCKFYIKKSTGAIGSLVAVLYAHTGTWGSTGKPTGAALATSTNTIDVSTLSDSSQALQTFNFDSSYQLSSGTHYCISLEYSGMNSGDTVMIGYNSSSGGFAGNRSYNNGSWGTLSGDLCFYVYGTLAVINASLALVINKQLSSIAAASTVPQYVASVAAAIKKQALSIAVASMVPQYVASVAAAVKKQTLAIAAASMVPQFVASIAAAIKSQVLLIVDVSTIPDLSTITEQLIVDMFIKRLQLISIASGYRTDMGLNIFESLQTNLDEDVSTAILRTGKDQIVHEATGAGTSLYHHKLNWVIEVVNIGNNATQEWIRDAKYDVQQVILLDDTFGGKAYNTEVVTAEPKYSQKGKKVVGAIITGTIDFRSEWNKKSLINSIPMIGTEFNEQLMSNAFLGKLSGILKSAGFYTDIGKNTFQSPTENLEDVVSNAEIPAVVLRMDNDEMNHDESGDKCEIFYDHRFTWAIEVISDGGNATPEWLRKAKYDVLKVILDDDSFGGLTYNCDVDSSAPVFPRVGRKKLSGIKINGHIDIRTQRMKAVA